MYDENDVIDSEEKKVDKRKLITGKFYNEQSDFIPELARDEDPIDPDLL